MQVEFQESHLEYEELLSKNKDKRSLGVMRELKGQKRR